MFEIGLLSVALMLAAVFMEQRRVLMMYQQNSYRTERYLRWIGESGDTTSAAHLVGLIVLFVGISPFGSSLVTAVLSGLFGLVMTITMLRRRYKKPLVMTARAKRLLAAALIEVGVVIWAVCAVFGVADTSALPTLIALALTGCFCASHMLMIGAGYMTAPIEKMINRRYYKDAQRRLAAMPDLKIIGITGSYGKTSTKHFLYRILSEEYDTLMTPGSYNTTMGVIRTIREYLKPYNEVFIVEMGAKQRGDVREICELVKPTIGIITAVGPQHLETFKTIENVCAAKFELADAVSTQPQGLMILNDDFEPIAQRKVDGCRCIRYKSDVSEESATAQIAEVEYGANGSSFSLVVPGGTHRFHTRLLGGCNISDLAAAILAAMAMNVPESKIKAAVASIEPVEHRLSVKRSAGGLTIIDDAYNSNPVGSRMALEVLGQFSSGKRIVITPGMIELGAEQEEHNRNLGVAIAENADVAIVVGRYNREAIVDGIRSKSAFNRDNVHLVDTFDEAQKLLCQIARAGDTVLYENDLPDTFK